MGVLSIFRRNKEVRNASWLIVGRLIQMPLSFIVSVLTARYLGSSVYGVINYANAYVTFFTSLCTLGINSVIIKELVDAPDRQGRIVGTSIVLRLISSVLSVIVIVAIVSIVDHHDKTIMIVAFLCSLALVFHAFDTINYWFQSRYASKTTAIITLIGHLAITVYKIALMLLKKDVVWFAASMAVDYACIAILLWIAYRKAGGQTLCVDFQFGKKLLGKSYHYILSGMMVAIYSQSDKIMLKHTVGESAVGLYSLATTICSLWAFVLTAIIDSVYPTIVQLHADHQQEQFDRKNRQLYAIVIYVSMFVGILFLFFGEWAIGLLYGEEYIGAAAPLKIVTWYTTFSYLGVARNAWIVCNNKQRYLKYMYLCGAVLNVLLNYVLIPVWGANGAAWASLITQVFTSIVIPYIIPDMRPNAKLMTEAFLLRKLR